jgi:hypothetical protein
MKETGPYPCSLRIKDVPLRGSSGPGNSFAYYFSVLYRYYSSPP